MEQIIDYIKQTYNPITIILYGSFASGTNNMNSDFDALVISKTAKKSHDTSFVGGIQLDVFVYPENYFDEKIDYGDFVQIYDGIVVLDTDNYGEIFKKHVVEYMNNLSIKTKEEVLNDIKWCKKMYLRTKRNDIEGMFRWHWVLIDSLEIFCSMMSRPYLGPKKSLIWMEKEYPEAFTCYSNALAHFDTDTLEQWINYLEKIFNE